MIKQISLAFLVFAAFSCSDLDTSAYRRKRGQDSIATREYAEKVTIEYFDENFVKHTDVLDGIAARVVQHEYDHIEGILFTDKISSLKKRLIKKKLENISKGNVNPDYRMKFPLLKRK